MLSIPCVRLTIKVKVGIPGSFKVGWYPPKKTGSSHLNVCYNKPRCKTRVFKSPLRDYNPQQRTPSLVQLASK